MLRFPTVMSKDKFIKIVLQMFLTDPSLMCPQQPSLEQRDNPIYVWQRSLGGAVGSYDYMLKSFFFEGAVSSPPICLHNTARFNEIHNKRDQTRCRKVRDMPHTNSSKPTSSFFDFHCHDDTSLLKALSSRNSRFLTTDKCVVDLNFIRQLFPTSSNHCRTNLMQPSPSGFVAPQAKNSFQSYCTSACFLGTNPPHSDKPHPQRLPGAFKNRPSCQRGLIVAVRAFNQVSIVNPPMSVATIRASESMRPSQRHQIRPTSFLRRKSVLKLQLGFWEIRGILIDHLDSIS